MKVKSGTKRCIKCLRVYPATLEYFRRDHNQKDKLTVYCKTCASDLIKAHYVKYTAMDVRLKGDLGVICPLWTDRCEQCYKINTCWRIKHNKPDDYPAKLVGSLRDKE